MPDAERLAYLGQSLSRDMMWGQKVRNVFPCLECNPNTEGCCKPRGEALFICKHYKVLCNLPGSSDLSQFWKELYQELVVDSTSDPLVEQFSWSLEEVHSQWNWVPCS